MWGGIFKDRNGYGDQHAVFFYRYFFLLKEIKMKNTETLKSKAFFPEINTFYKKKTLNL